MRRRLLTVALCLAMGSMTALWAQAVQNVVVKEYQAKNQKTPLADVGVTVGNAGAAMTDGDGRAMLRFRSLKAGDRVTLRRVEKAGYEVFNRDAVEQWTVSPSADFQLVLCRSDKFRQLRDQYQRVASQSYDRQYKAEQQRLANERKEGKLQEEAYQQRLLDLQDQYEQQLEDLENYVDKFARIDLSELSAQEQQLVELVQQGKIDEAIALYEQHDYLGQYQRETRDIEEIDRAQQRLAEVEVEKRRQREAVMASIDRQVNTYQLAGGRENFEKIGKLLKGVADADTTNLRTVRNYVEHAVMQTDFDEAERYLLVLARNAQDWHDLVSAYSWMTIMYSQLQRDEEVEKYYELWLRLLRSRMDPDSYTDVAALATSLMVRQNYLLTACRYAESLADVEEIMQLLSRLEQMEPAEATRLAQQRMLTESRQGLALALSEQDAQRGEQQCRNAYEQYKAALDSQEREQVEDFHQTIENMLLLLESQDRWNEQLPYLLEQLEMVRLQYRQNPAFAQMRLFECLANLADTYVQSDALAQALPLMTEAETLLPVLQERFKSGSFAVNEMGFYDTEAMYYQKAGDRDQMVSYARRCLEAFERMPADMKEGYTEVRQRWQDLVQP